MKNITTEGAKILVADDNFEILGLLGKILSEEKFQVLPASTGKQTLSMASAKNPDLILLDIGLPDMDGLNVCRKLKGDIKTENIPIIFLTGKVEEQDLIRGFECGGTDYITKPFKQTELLARVQTHVRLRKMQARIASDREIIHQKEKELLKTELDLRNRELVSVTARLLSYSKQTLDMTEKIRSMIEEAGSGPAEKILPEIHFFHQQLEANNWNEFETYFAKLHSGFFQNLLERFPSLSKNELKICAFIRMNLSVKDISSITLQSEEAIKKAKYRLRQKLDIDEDSNLIGVLTAY
jgi:DNA-binding response OmpR family regulator